MKCLLRKKKRREYQAAHLHISVNSLSFLIQRIVVNN